MNALQSYSSDSDSEAESPATKAPKPKDPGTNYDEVGMDISEGSDDDQDHHKGKAIQGSGGVTKEQRPSSISKHNTSSGSSHAGRGKGVEEDDKSQSREHKVVNEKNPGEGSKHKTSLQERLLGLANQSCVRRQTSHDEDKSKESRRERSPHERTGNQRKSRSRSPRRSHGSSRRSRSRSRERSRHRPRTRSPSPSRSSSRRSKDEERSGRRRDDDRKSRRSRSRSRERRRSRSRSRDKRSRSRSRDRDRRRYDRNVERKRPIDIRKDAQQKLAALKAANPNFNAADLLKQSLEAQVAEVQKQTGISLPTYYNPAAMNPLKFAEQERKRKLLWGNKFAEQEQKRKLLWGNKSKPTPGVVATLGSQIPAAAAGTSQSQIAPGGTNKSIWEATTFSNDRDGKMAEKFKRLMGVRNATNNESDKSKELPDQLNQQESLFMNMERQYEMARLATHTHKGFGLGFTSQSFVPK
ncbi:uncharacterized protein LOC143018193 isoform X2 [Oratosquilla oratoria]|uniref:uncharacterized protein LOC143018193 isoform X2 n=1 Tax=Oratosquilla oratoria TaxID=337810 RepID=UPI003F7659C1